MVISDKKIEKMVTTDRKMGRLLLSGTDPECERGGHGFP
jgi:hypothetical protein